MILVIGGTGLVGSHLLFELMKEQRSVRCLYRSKNKITKVQQLFDYYSNNQSHRFHAIEWIQGDILDALSLQEAMKNVRIVYHCAALVSFVRRDFKKLLEINQRGTANVVNFALKHGIEKLAYVSSTATICGKNNQPTTEKDRWSPSTHTTGYAISKYNAEREVWRASQEGLKVVIINPSVVFGAGDFMNSSMAIFIAIKNGLRIYSPGANAFVDARNVATSLVQLTEDNFENERYICMGTNASFQEMLTTIAHVLEVPPPTICLPKWIAIFAGRMSETIARITRTTPRITLESMRSAYATEKYANTKITQATHMKWYSLRESFQNARDFQQWKENQKHDQ